MGMQVYCDNKVVKEVAMVNKEVYLFVLKIRISTNFLRNME